MLFNTAQFFVFFLIVYFLYLNLNHKWQNRMLLVASYIFYGSWDWRFLSLIVVSTVLDYYCGLRIYKTDNIKKKKIFLIASIIGNLSILGFFKYFNFFASSLESVLGRFGFQIHPHFLNIVLPVGISFYTFQTMSYTLDIYRSKLKPTDRFFDFALFVAFFPQLVAGPIERAKHLLPQILSPRKFKVEWFYQGLYLIFWGLFLKVFVADNLAKIVDPVFAIYPAKPSYNGMKVLITLYAFAFQIFCDFAGYSSIARGLGRLMGFDIMINFNTPYFATNPRDLWCRWHISLSSWLRDYIYIPLGGNKKGSIVTYRNLIITMILGGLWHGAAWTFVVWGAYHGFLLIAYRLLEPVLIKIPSPKGYFLKKIWSAARILFFFHLILLGYLIFRAQSMGQAYSMFRSILFNFSPRFAIFKYYALYIVFYTWLLLLVQIFQRKKDNIMVVLQWPAIVRFAVFLLMFYLILMWGEFGGKEFIYFQF